MKHKPERMCVYFYNYLQSSEVTLILLQVYFHICSDDKEDLIIGKCSTADIRRIIIVGGLTHMWQRWIRKW